MAALFKIWAVTSWEDYSENWPSSVGPFKQLTEYQKSLGFTSPEDFFTKQAIAAQNLANDKIANLLERVFSTKDLSEKVQFQLRKFTYQAIDFIRMNDSIIGEDVRQSQTTINNQRLDSTFINIDSVEGLVGAAAWRSWKLASLEKLYHSWAQTKGIEYLLDPTRFYNKGEIDYKLSLIDDQIQVQQTLIDEKLTEFNAEMETKLSIFRNELNDDPDLITNIGDNLTKNSDFISKTAELINSSLVTEEYVDEKLKELEGNIPTLAGVPALQESIAAAETKTEHDNDFNDLSKKITTNGGLITNLNENKESVLSHDEDMRKIRVSHDERTNIGWLSQINLGNASIYFCTATIKYGGLDNEWAVSFVINTRPGGVAYNYSVVMTPDNTTAVVLGYVSARVDSDNNLIISMHGIHTKASSPLIRYSWWNGEQLLNKVVVPKADEEISEKER